MIKFNNMTQTKDESYNDWADRVLSQATLAFRHLPEDYMQSQVILRFCLGCKDKDAGESVANMHPPTVEEAVDKVKWAVHTHGQVRGKAKAFGGSQGIGEDDVHVAAVRFAQEDRVDKLESRIDKMEVRMERMERKMDQVLEKLDSISSRSRPQSPRRSLAQVLSVTTARNLVTIPGIVRLNRQH